MRLLYSGDYLWLEEDGRTTTTSLRFMVQSMYVREVTGREMRAMQGWDGGPLLPRWPEEMAPGWFLAPRSEYRDAAVYAVEPVCSALRLARWLREWRWPLYRLGFIEGDEHGYYGPGARWHWNILAVHRRNLARWRKHWPGLTGREYVRAFILRRGY